MIKPGRRDSVKLPSQEGSIFLSTRANSVFAASHPTPATHKADPFKTPPTQDNKEGEAPATPQLRAEITSQAAGEAVSLVNITGPLPPPDVTARSRRQLRPSPPAPPPTQQRTGSIGSQPHAQHLPPSGGKWPFMLTAAARQESTLLRCAAKICRCRTSLIMQASSEITAEGT